MPRRARCTAALRTCATRSRVRRGAGGAVAGMAQLLPALPAADAATRVVAMDTAWGAIHPCSHSRHGSRCLLRCCTTPAAQLLFFFAFLLLRNHRVPTLPCRPGILPGPQPAVGGARRCGGHLQHHLRPAAAGARQQLRLVALPGRRSWPGRWPAAAGRRSGCSLCGWMLQHPPLGAAHGRKRRSRAECAVVPSPFCLLQHQKDCKFREQLKQGAAAAR